MTNTAITTTDHEFDAFCDCTACNAQLQAGLAAVNANLVRETDNFDNETPAPVSAPCLRCGRTLRSAKSVALGYGPTCARKIAAAEEATDATPAAIELIEDGAIVRSGSLYLAVSSDGSTRYETDPYRQTCSCKAGQYGRACKHLAAATALAAA